MDGCLFDEYGDNSKCREVVNEEGCDGFECNICLDPVQDAVVTVCGHLYCWRCIYKWIHMESSVEKTEQQRRRWRPQCPVCKAEVSERRLIPLYAARGGGGGGHKEQKGCLSAIPPRPSFSSSSSSSSSSCYPNPCQQVYSDQFSVAGGMNGEMIYDIMFGNSITSHDQNSYGRWRSRHSVETERSLGRLSVFLLCFLIYCLVLF